MFPVKSIQYELNASRRIELHPVVPSITLRGAFGYALCQLIARDDMIPEMRGKVQMFKDFFMPSNDGRTTATHKDLPRPFLIRGDYSRPNFRSFIVEIVLWGEAIKYEPLFDQVMSLVAIMGLGRNNVECRLVKLHAKIVDTTFPDSTFAVYANFLTPAVRVVYQQQLCRDEIPFPALFARLLDRFDQIDRVYGEKIGVAEDEAIALKYAAQNIASRPLAVIPQKTQRTSTRTGQTMPISGFAGQMEYCGDFSAFAPYLGFLPWINIGHCSTFGCGWVTLSCQSATS